MDPDSFRIIAVCVVTLMVLVPGFIATLVTWDDILRTQACVIAGISIVLAVGLDVLVVIFANPIMRILNLTK